MLRPWCTASLAKLRARAFSGSLEALPARAGLLTRIGLAEETQFPPTMKTSDVMVKALENENIE